MERSKLIKKIIICQPRERKRTYDKIIIGSIHIESKLLEPKMKYKVTITPYKQAK